MNEHHHEKRIWRDPKNHVLSSVRKDCRKGDILECPSKTYLVKVSTIAILHSKNSQI